MVVADEDNHVRRLGDLYGSPYEQNSRLIWLSQRVGWGKQRAPQHSAATAPDCCRSVTALVSMPAHRLCCNPHIVSFTTIFLEVNLK